MADKQLATRSTESIAASEAVVDQLGAIADPMSVFSEPIQQGDRLIITCAEVFAAMGMGAGSGTDKNSKGSSGGGSGSGGTARSRPVAAIIIDRDGVTVEPIVDATKVALASITAGAFMVSWLFRMKRATRSAKRGKDPSFEEARKAIGGS